MEHIATFAKVLGSLFYFPVTHENNRQLCAALRDHDAEKASPFHDVLVAMDKETPEALAEDFQQLFEGCEVMPAPPWGSVYLDKEQVIFGESTVAFRHFLTAQDMALDTGMREPEDQFGLMLLAMAQLIEGADASQDDAESREAESTEVEGTEAQRAVVLDALLQTHLLPWAYRYLTLVQTHAQTDTYRLLAELAEAWLQVIQEEREITPDTMKVYF